MGNIQKEWRRIWCDRRYVRKSYDGYEYRNILPCLYCKWKSSRTFVGIAQRGGNNSGYPFSSRTVTTPEIYKHVQTIILELKVAHTYALLEENAEEALQKVEENGMMHNYGWKDTKHLWNMGLLFIRSCVRWLVNSRKELSRFCSLNSFFDMCLCTDWLLVKADYFIDKMSDATYDRKNIIRISVCCKWNIWRLGFLKSGKNKKEVLEHAQRLSYSVGGTAVWHFHWLSLFISICCLPFYGFSSWPGCPTRTANTPAKQVWSLQIIWSIGSR